MLERQRTSVDILERLAFLADASGRSSEMAGYLMPLIDNPDQPRSMGDMLQRRGRALAEEAIMPPLWSFTAVRSNITSARVGGLRHSQICSIQTAQLPCMPSDAFRKRRPNGRH